MFKDQEEQKEFERWAFLGKDISETTFGLELWNINHPEHYIPSTISVHDSLQKMVEIWKEEKEKRKLIPDVMEDELKDPT